MPFGGGRRGAPVPTPAPRWPCPVGTPVTELPRAGGDRCRGAAGINRNAPKSAGKLLARLEKEPSVSPSPPGRIFGRRGGAKGSGAGRGARAAWPRLRQRSTAPCQHPPGLGQASPAPPGNPRRAPPFPCRGRANLVPAACQSEAAPGHPRHGPGGVARAPRAPGRPRSPLPGGPSPGRASSLTDLLCRETFYHGERDSESRCPDPAVRLRRNRRRLVSSRRVRGRGEAASALQPCQIPGMHARAGSCAPPRPLAAQVWGWHGVGTAPRDPPLQGQAPPLLGGCLSWPSFRFSTQIWASELLRPIAAPKWCHRLAALLNCALCWA